MLDQRRRRWANIEDVGPMLYNCYKMFCACWVVVEGFNTAGLLLIRYDLFPRIHNLKSIPSFQAIFRSLINISDEWTMLRIFCFFIHFPAALNLGCGIT